MDELAWIDIMEHSRESIKEVFQQKMKIYKDNVSVIFEQKIVLSDDERRYVRTFEEYRVDGPNFVDGAWQDDPKNRIT